MSYIFNYRNTGDITPFVHTCWMLSRFRPFLHVSLHPELQNKTSILHHIITAFCWIACHSFALQPASVFPGDIFVRVLQSVLLDVKDISILNTATPARFYFSFDACTSRTLHHSPLSLPSAQHSHSVSSHFLSQNIPVCYSPESLWSPPSWPIAAIHAAHLWVVVLFLIQPVIYILEYMKQA